jgi:radical SAM-linked protein
MVRTRLRIRFRKEEDLRFIGHRDLLRAWERWFRRAGLPLAMSAGFHPKPRIFLPAALAVGILGENELLDVELVDAPEPPEVEARLAASAPPGLVVTSVRALGPDDPKPRVRQVSFALPLPVELHSEARERVAALWAAPECWIDRQPEGRRVEIRRALSELELREGVLRLRLEVPLDGGVRPREVLAALGLAELEHRGAVLARTDVVLEVAPPPTPAALLSSDSTTVRACDLPTQKARE